MEDKNFADAAAAQYRLAALEARTGSANCVTTLTEAFETLREMRETDVPPDEFPGLTSTTLKMTSPMDWVTVKAPSMEAHAMGLLFAIQRAQGEYEFLIEKFPGEPAFRDDLASVLKLSATLQSAVPGRKGFALEAWVKASKTLETIVKDVPDNPDFQNRLVESLVGAARLQKDAGETEQAVANYKRAVEVRQQMSDANPDDKTLAQELAKVKSDLEKLQPQASSPPADAAAAKQ